MKKKTWSMLLALCLVLSLLPLTAFASEPAGGLLPQPEPEINVEFTDAAAGEMSLSTEVCTSVEEAAAVLRAGIKQRETSISFTYVDEEPMSRDKLHEIYVTALEHTGVPTEGDYIRWQIGKNRSSASTSYNGVTYTSSITYTFDSFHDTLAQEQETDAAVAAIVGELSGKSDYEVVKGIYDYLGETVTYDDAAAAIPSDQVTDHTPWTAYGALVKHQAVCQGYALAFYRLALELGIDARIVTGIGAGGDHAWIAAELDGLYYYLDPTWGGEKWFLKGTSDFNDHYPEDSSLEFLQDMWLSETNYAPSTILGSGSCGDSLTWKLLSNGVMFIEGQGAMPDYMVPSEAPFSDFSESIRKVKFCDGVTGIASFAFYECGNLSGVRIPDSVTSIGRSAFELCTSLERIVIPDSVTDLGDNLFARCSNLKQAELPSEIGGIPSDLFYGCTNLEAIEIPDTVQWFGEYAFAGCESLKELHIPDGVTELPLAFMDQCRGVESIHIPDSVTIIGRDAFSQCSGLKEITIPEHVTDIGYWAFAGCTGLEEVVIPDSVEYVAQFVFQGCTNLKRVALSSQMQTIAWNTFENCSSLQEITIPVGITKIYGSAFNGCTGLTDIYYGGTRAQWDQIEFDGDPDPALTATIHCQGDPVITAQPADVIGGLNATVSFSVQAEGEGLSYQWQISDNHGASWSNSSVKSAVYSTKLTAGRDGRMVRCIVTSSNGGSVISDAATMTLSSLKITSQPQNYVGKVNSTASFTVQAEGDGLTYQWQISDDGVKWSNSSVKTAKYSTKLTSAKDGRLVRCVVTDQHGVSATSQTVSMTVYSFGITTQPKDYSGAVNSTASFTVAAIGDGLTYQWQYSDNGTKWSNSSVKSAVYSTKLTDARDGRQIRCIVTDQYGNSATSSVAVMHIAGPTITTQPQDYVGKENSTAKFTIAAQGDGLTYQWQTSADGSKWSNSSVKAASYSTKLTAAKDGRYVRCIVTDPDGHSTTSNAVTMRIG